MIYESQYLHVFFLFFIFERPLKDCPFFSPLILTLWFPYLQIHIKESCVYLSHQLFQNSPWNSKIARKTQDKGILKQSADLDFTNFPFVVYHMTTPQNYRTKQMVKKLNIWWNTAEDKSASIKSWIGNHLYLHKTNFFAF